MSILRRILDWLRGIPPGIRCVDCYGAGFRPPYKKCPTCGGKGYA